MACSGAPSRAVPVRLLVWWLLVALLPLLKWIEVPSWSMYLWAEDADLFLRQAIDLGWSSVWTPYAGYFHLISRLLALCASLLTPVAYPMVFAAGWWLVYLSSVALLLRWSSLLRLPWPWGGVAVVSVVLQPHGGEVFFSITNAQWWLGLYLFIYFIWFDQATTRHALARWVDGACIVLAGLSGPFAFMAWPVVALRRWSEGAGFRWTWQHAWLFVAGAVQLTSFVAGDRIHRHADAEVQVGPWGVAFVKLLAFCADTPAQWAVAMAFLVLGGWVVVRVAGRQQLAGRSDGLIVVLCMVMLLLAGIWAHNFDPLQAVPQGTGNRYTWIPYALLILLVCRHAGAAPVWSQVCLVALLACLCYLGHRPVLRSDLRYAAFADFARIKAVDALVHPQVEGWPGWRLVLRPDASSNQAPPPSDVFRAGVTPVAALHAHLDVDARDWRLISRQDDPQLMFLRPLNCGPARSVGVEVHMWRSSPGWVQLFWSPDRRFGGRRSLRRFLPAGDMVAQFAFPHSGRPTYLRLDPADAEVDARIQSVDIHCIAK